MEESTQMKSMEESTNMKSKYDSSSSSNSNSTTSSGSSNSNSTTSSSRPVVYQASINVRNDYVLPIPVSSDSSVSYSFTTKPSDISFGMSFKTISGSEIILRKKERIECHIAAAVGIVNCPEEDGVLYLTWDNSYSWMTNKELSYKVEISRSCTLEVMTEMKNKISTLLSELSESNKALLIANTNKEALISEKISHNEIILESHKQIKLLVDKLNFQETENHELHGKLTECTQSLDSTKISLEKSQQLLLIANVKMEEAIQRVVTEEMHKREKLESEVKKYLNEISSSKTFFNEMEDFHKQREKDLEDQITQLKEQVVELSKESDYRELIKSSYEDSMNDMKELFQAEKDVLVGKVEGLHIEMEVLKHDKVKHNEEIQEKLETIKTLEDNVVKWVTSIKDLKIIFSSEKELLESEVKALRDANVKLNSDVKSLEAANEKFRAEQITWINSSEKQSDRDTEFEKLKNQYRNIIEQQESTAKEHADLKISYQKASNEIKDLHCSLLQSKASAEEISRKLEKQIEISVNNAKHYKKEFDDLNNRYSNKNNDGEVEHPEKIDIIQEAAKEQTKDDNISEVSLTSPAKNAALSDNSSDWSTGLSGFFGKL